MPLHGGQINVLSFQARKAVAAGGRSWDEDPAVLSESFIAGSTGPPGALAGRVLVDIV